MKEKIDIKTYFPKTCMITNEMINSNQNIGTQLLKSFLPESLHPLIFWGLSIGNVGDIKIKTEQTILYQNKLITVPQYLDKNIKPNTYITFNIR